MINHKWEKNNHACILPPLGLDKIAESGWGHVRNRGRMENCGITSFRHDMYTSILNSEQFW